MKIEGYEEISYKEFNGLPSDKVAAFNTLSESDLRYFKKAQKFPIVFEDDSYKIKLGTEYVRIIFKRSKGDFYFHINHSLPLLVKAVEKAKEVMKKNEN